MNLLVAPNSVTFAPETVQALSPVGSPATRRDVRDPARLRALLPTAIKADRYQLDENRTVTLDLSTVVAAKANRYLAVAALLTLGESRCPRSFGMTM